MLAFLGAMAVAMFSTGGRAADLVVTLWGVGMMGTPYAVAMEKGIFKEAALPITGIIGGGGGNVLRNMLANELPYGEIAVPAVIAATKQGLPIVVVNSGNIAADNIWITMPNSPVKTVKDLVGRKAAFTTPKSISEAFLRMTLTNAGVNPTSLTLMPAGGIGPGLTMLENGVVDTALIIEPDFHVRAGKYNVLFRVIDTLPPMMGTVGVTTRQFAQEHPDRLRSIIAARRKAVDFVYANPEESGRLLAKAYSIDPHAAVEAAKAMAKAGYWQSGDIDIRLLKNLAAGMRVTGELQGDFDWSTIVDASFLPADLKAKSKLGPQ